jgi:hemoglobin
LTDAFDRRLWAGSTLRRRAGGEVMNGSLYERLGGKDAITSVIDDFVARCAADSRINAKFVRTEVPRLKANLVDQVCEATGGPCTYTGRDMRTTHDGMAVTGGEFAALVEDLLTTLDRFGVGESEKSELVGALAPMRADIVEVESSETGTPLPDTYLNAPATTSAGALN